MKDAAQKQSKATTQDFIEILDIIGDVVLLKDGSCATIIETTAVNFSLLSAQEQDATILGFSALLNSLSFPIQIVISSRKLDLTSYLARLNTLSTNQKNQLLKTQMEKYHDFVQGLMQQNTILDKRFYIVIPLSPLELGLSASTSSLLKIGALPMVKRDLLVKAQATLAPKREQILELLGRMGLRGTVLEKETLVNLFSRIFNAKMGPTMGGL